MGAITLTINANSSEDLLNHVRELQMAVLGQVVSGTQMNVGAGSEPKSEPKAKSKSAAKEKPTLSVAEANTQGATESAVKESAPVVAQVSAEKSNATVEPGNKSKEDVAKSLQDLTATKDIAKAKEVLARFKNAAGAPCARMSDIQIGDYDDFVATCEAEAKA